jgi:hypothetical protein
MFSHTSFALPFSSSYTSEIALSVFPMIFISSAYPVSCTTSYIYKDQIRFAILLLHTRWCPRWSHF